MRDRDRPLRSILGPPRQPDPRRLRGPAGETFPSRHRPLKRPRQLTATLVLWPVDKLAPGEPDQLSTGVALARLDARTFIQRLFTPDRPRRVEASRYNERTSRKESLVRSRLLEVERDESTRGGRPGWSPPVTGSCPVRPTVKSLIGAIYIHAYVSGLLKYS